MKPLKRWQEDEIEFLKTNYAKHGAGYCGENLGRSPESVARKAANLKIKRDGISRYQRKETPSGYSHCWMCDNILPDSQFYKKTAEGKYGKKSNCCRSCSQNKARHHYGKYKWTMFRRREKDPIHFIFVRLKGSAKKKKYKLRFNRKRPS